MNRDIDDGRSIRFRYRNEILSFNMPYDEIYRCNENHPSLYEINKSRCAELEIMRHVGGRILYGKLGVLIEPTKEKDIQIEIPYTYKNSVPYEESILLDKKYCYNGITVEYVEGIKEAIQDYICNSTVFPKCKITIVSAANCEAGSCLAFYKLIIDILLDIYCNKRIPDIEKSDDKKFMEYIKEKIIGT